MSFKFILDAVKEKFEAEDKYENQGFPDLNYEVGNTSGLDIAPGVPSAMDERIGSLAQRGGSVMEVIINNPSTFQIDREKMLNVINGLEIDISIHSDPSVGYTSTYRASYDPTHNYFTKYLEQFASFKRDVEKRSEKDDNNFEGFNITRINPHISTDPLPALEEERAGGTGLDPFGYSLTDLKEDVMEEKTEQGKNIYKNPKFLRRLYRVFIAEEFGDNEYQYYQNLSSFSPKFDKEWRKAQNDVAERYYNTMTGGNGKDPLEDKADVISAVSAADPAIQKEWLTLLPKEEFEFQNPVTIPPNTALAGLVESEAELTSISNLKDLDDFIRAALSQRYRLSELRTLSNLLYFMESQELDRVRSRRYGGEVDLKIPEDGFQEKLWEQAKKSIEKALDKLWREEDTEDERKVSLIPVQAKVSGLTQQLEIPQGKVAEEAFRDNKSDLRQEVANMFAGDPESFKHDKNEEINPEKQYERFLRVFIRNFERQMWMESNSLYQIIPAWLDVADYDSEKEENEKGHTGWEAPKFLWELLVKQKWEEERGETIDLLHPRGKEDEKGFLDLLEENEEFQRDVAAASAGAYVWSHFTQNKARFKLNDRILKTAFSGEEVEHNEVEMTWIEWMNKFGIGVNLEAMPGSPQQMYKIWRPKDIAAAARAINITARKELDSMHPELDEMPAKFTIDLEHTATFGDDPWDTMEELIEQEASLAESSLAEKYDIKIDKSKPLAKILRMWHLMRAGLETSQSETLHGPWDPGDTQLYEQLYKMIYAGFARNEDEKAYIMYEVGGDDRGTVYIARVAMNLIELGVTPDELDPSKVDPGKEYRDEKEALMARFFGMDRPTYDREWAKIEEHAFDPLQGLLSAEEFGHTHTSSAAIEEGNQPRDWMGEEYK